MTFGPTYFGFIRRFRYCGAGPHSGTQALALVPDINHPDHHSSIGDLSDGDLIHIFKQLPPYDRLIVSEVCRRWLGISRQSWPDIKHLDFSPSSIFSPNVGAVVSQCPNLQSVFARGQNFGLKHLFCLHETRSLSTIKLYDCKFAMQCSRVPGAYFDYFIDQVFFRDTSDTSWSELVLHDALFHDESAVSEAGIIIGIYFLPPSLKRLQLSGLRSLPAPDGRWTWWATMGLDRLENLECLIFHATPGAPLLANAHYWISHCPPSLRELCIGSLPIDRATVDDEPLFSNLPHLEVLFINDFSGDPARLVQVITRRSVLRILVLSGKFRSNAVTQVPARNFYPDKDYEADPVPLLHIFVGREASERLSFERPTMRHNRAAEIHPIDKPMPEFLERKDIAPIFKGVWVAEQITAMAKFGGKLWDYSAHDTAVSVHRY